MTHPTNAGRASTTEPEEALHLPAAAVDLLEVARQARAGRAGRTLVPGVGAALKQSLLALVHGQALADHESPGAATLQVLLGRVRLTAAGRALVLEAGDFAPIPPVRHGLESLADAVVLITVAQALDGAEGRQTVGTR